MEWEESSLSAFAAIFIAYGGVGVIAFTFLLVTLKVNGTLSGLSGVEWLAVLIGIFLSLYQIFVGFGLEYRKPATQRFVYHFSLYASIILITTITYSLYHAWTTGEFGGVLASLVALPYLAFYGISAYTFRHPQVQEYFIENNEEDE